MWSFTFKIFFLLILLFSSQKIFLPVSAIQQASFSFALLEQTLLGDQW